MVRTLRNFSSLLLAICLKALSVAHGFLLGSLDGFHKATEIKFIILGVCIFLGRVFKTSIKFTWKISERFIFMKVNKS